MYDLSLLPPRVLDRIVFDGYSGCWRWAGELKKGYGQVQVAGRRTSAHRYVYELLVGPITDGLTLDHRCHTDDLACLGGVGCPHRACVWPEHLEPVTAEENARRGRSANLRKTHCPRGHPYDEENTIWSTAPRGGPSRICRACYVLHYQKPLIDCRRCGRAVDGANVGLTSSGRRACLACLPEIEAKRQKLLTRGQKSG